MTTVQHKVIDKTSKEHGSNSSDSRIGSPMPSGYTSAKHLPVGVEFPTTSGVKSIPTSNRERVLVIMEGSDEPVLITFSSDYIDHVRIKKIIEPENVELVGYYK